MVDFSCSPNPILDAIQVVYSSLRDSEMSPESLNTVQSEIDTLTAFFQCEKQQSALLAVLFGLRLENDSNTVSEMIEHLALKPSASIYINTLFQNFVNKNWIRPKQDVRMNPMTEYIIQSALILAVNTGSWDANQERPVENSLQVLNKFNNKLRERRERQISFDQFVENTYNLINQYERLKLPAFILDLDLEPVDAAYFMYMCFQYYKGEESVDISTILFDLYPKPEEQYVFRSNLKTGKSVFFEIGLLETVKTENLFLGDQIRLTKSAVSAFSDIDFGDKVAVKSDILQEIEPKTIVPQILIYNPEEGEQISNITNLLEYKQFDKFCDRMTEKRMVAGVTILLHGRPGTGKTETVMQWAQKTKRILLTCDASVVRGKWVGESEKNIRQVFNDYRSVLETAEEVPILFFNEADSFFSKRRSVKSGVDQMENTVQNILLEELEKFEGIFVATTNLTENLDKAMDRRFLFKIHLENPDMDTRTKILISRFPDVDQKIISLVSEKFELTGGQILNIRKKIEIELLLNPEILIDEKYFFKLAEQETALDKGRREPVGFSLHSKTT